MGRQRQLGCAIQQHTANVPYCLGGVQAFGANVDAILNAVTPKDTKRVIQTGQPLLGRRVAAIRQESIRLQQPRRPHEPVGVPPERRATGRATGTQNTFIQAVKL